MEKHSRGRAMAVAASLLTAALLTGCSGKTDSAPTSAGGADGGGADGGGAGGGGAGGGGGSGGALPVCADYVPHGPACRTPSDCDGGADCNPWNVGGCVFMCGADADCGDGFVCTHDCPHCEPACTPTSCSTGKVCGANGQCTPQACDAGYDCGADGTCSPKAAGADSHGCSPHWCATQGYQCPPNTRCDSTGPDAHGCSALPCLTDTDCDCGVCWEGKCASGPGWCGGVPL